MKNTLLRTARRRQGWNQQQLADFAGISLSTVERAERGEPLRIDNIQRLCTCLQMSPEQLGLLTTENRQANHQIDERGKDNASRWSAERFSIHQKTYDVLAQYLREQQVRILNTLASGSTHLKVKDIIGRDGLFISPPWEEWQGTATSTDLVKHLIAALMNGQQILLLGSAGQGKTTLLKYIFTLMVDSFLERVTDTDRFFPLYIPLREFARVTGDAVELLWSYMNEDFPLPFDEFERLMRNKRTVFLFDGFDEIKGKLTQHSINERAMSKLFTHPSILSCRKSFFEFYLLMSTLREHYSQVIELQPLRLDSSVSKYIVAFCEQQKKKVAKDIITSEKIIGTIRETSELQDLIQRPLLLLMALEVFTSSDNMTEGQWNKTNLYQKYTEKWLKNEAAKADSVLRWDEKRTLVQKVAWFVYTTRYVTSSQHSQNLTFSRSELSQMLQSVSNMYPHLSETQILDDLCFRTVLATSEGEKYYFLHKSFQEYFVAKYIFQSMLNRGVNSSNINVIGNTLQEFLPAEIGTFLKEMLEGDDVLRSDKDVIATNLIKVYQHYRGDDSCSITIRQHASHYLALLRTEPSVRFLEHAYTHESDKWVQRGMMVGLALYCKRADILEQYIKMIREDTEVASINLGYYLAYYGDQARELGYYDQGGEYCDGTIRAIFRRLRDRRYQSGWTLDILTLSTLLETRGMMPITTQKQYLTFLNDFLQIDNLDLDETFQQEKRRLQANLEEGLWVQ